MTDYAKHIETLQRTASHDMHAREALTAAIELMRTALADKSEEKPYKPKYMTRTMSGHLMCALCYELNSQCDDCKKAVKP